MAHQAHGQDSPLMSSATEPPRATPEDHRLAESLAHATGEVLLEVRRELAARGAEPAELRAAGDQAAHEFLATRLRLDAPADAVLSEEASGARDAADPSRLAAPRLWVVDPLDGTNEYGNPERSDWAVHVALIIDHQPVAAAVSMPALGSVWSTASPPAPLPSRDRPPRIVVSRSRRPPWADALADRLGGEVVSLGSAGAKVMSIVSGSNDIYVHDAGQYEWDSAAPIGVARAAGLHTSRVDGSPLTYNNEHPRMPDLLVCRADLAHETLAAIRELNA